MIRPNAKNERQKRAYFSYLREAHGRDDATIDQVASSLARFEASTAARDFRRFHRGQAIAFKAKLSEAVSAQTGKSLSKATVHSTLRDLRAFFLWLAQEPGYRSKIVFADADYFNLSDKDVAIARARRKGQPPTIDDMKRVLEVLPAGTVLERRDRALIACACLTGARSAALASFQLGHVNLVDGYIHHDPRSVRTKFAKTFRGDLHRLVAGAVEAFGDWCRELQRDHDWRADDPLFPQTDMGVGADGAFVPVGILRKGWSTSQPVRDAFKRAFAAAGMPYYNPHLMRDMLVHRYMSMNLTPAQFKAVSQSLGHSDVLTTFTSYGVLPEYKQSELIKNIAPNTGADPHDPVKMLETIVARLKSDHANRSVISG